MKDIFNSHLFFQKKELDRIGFIFIKDKVQLTILEEKIDTTANMNKFFYFKINKQLSDILKNFSFEIRFYDSKSKIDFKTSIPEKFMNNINFNCVNNIIQKKEYLDYSKDELFYIRCNKKSLDIENIIINNQK